MLHALGSAPVQHDAQPGLARRGEGQPHAYAPDIYIYIYIYIYVYIYIYIERERVREK